MPIWDMNELEEENNYRNQLFWTKYLYGKVVKGRYSYPGNEEFLDLCLCDSLSSLRPKYSPSSVIYSSCSLHMVPLATFNRVRRRLDTPRDGNGDPRILHEDKGVFSGFVMSATPAMHLGSAAARRRFLIFRFRPDRRRRRGVSARSRGHRGFVFRNLLARSDGDAIMLRISSR